MKKALVAIVSVVFSSTSALFAASLVDAVNPLIGTDSTFELSNGNTLPLVALPWAMASWTPQTTDARWIYRYKHNTVQGIRLTHQPSPWIGDYGQFCLMPMVGTLEMNTKRRAQKFEHANERIRPYGYHLELPTQKITVELAPTMRGGKFRFSFPTSEQSYVVLDVPGPNSYVCVIPEQNKIVGFSSAKEAGAPKNFANYFVIAFDRPFLSFGTTAARQQRSFERERRGENLGAFVQFRTEKSQAVDVSVATSFISLSQAEENLAREIGKKTFDTIQSEAKQVWETQLRKIEIEGATNDQLTVFYTAFYRALLFPHTFHELNSDGHERHYSPYDGKVHSGVLYTDNGFWDTFRAVFPFFTVLFPTQDGEIIQGFVNTFKEGGWFPQWPSPGYRDCMIGSHSDSIVADAFVKGIRNFDVAAAYEGSVKNGREQSRKGQFGRKSLKYLRDLGYIPCDRRDQATSRTLEYAYDDFCLSTFAAARGKKEDEAEFAKGARAYKNVFNPATGFMQGRKEDGSWREPFDQFEWGEPYTEGNAWHYLWFVPHDVGGLIDLLGGKRAFAEKLDKLFALPATINVGSYHETTHDMREMRKAGMGQYHHGNEPVHHLAYLYNWADEPWKTQALVRKILTRLYSAKPDGLCGDEDTGQMSAWYLFSAMGFYPVCPGKPEYSLGSPLFRKVVLHLENNKIFTIESPRNSAHNLYVKTIQLNGQVIKDFRLRHSDIVAGGTLRFEMVAEPEHRLK